MRTAMKSKGDSGKIEKLPRTKIELLSGPMDGLEFELTKDMVTIGRSQDNDISIPSDMLMSRTHAKLIYENESYCIEDVGSRNGTFIGETKISKKMKLPISTIFRMGASEMRLIVTD